MKITIYTITDCKFSQAEKQFLLSKQLQFEEKNLEANREFLTQMLNISNNFAGTPVTKIEKDDGQIMVLKGFTQEEFEKALEAPIPPVAAPTPQPEPIAMPQAPEPPAPPVANIPPTPQPPVPMNLNEPIAPMQQPAMNMPPDMPPPAPQPEPPQPDNQALNSVLQNLQTRSADTT